MNSPKSARKNPTMGQIDATVIEAGARQAYQAAAEAAEATGIPIPPIDERKYNINIDARKVEAPVQQVGVTPKPIGLLGMVRSIPWYGWVAGGMAALFAAAVIGDVNEKPAKASKNRARDDNDDDEDVDPNDDDLETLEDDEDLEDEEESEDEEIDDSEDEEVDGDSDDDSEDEEIDADEIEDDEEDSVEQNRTSRKKPGKRERVIEDGQPDQKPVESAVGGRK